MFDAAIASMGAMRALRNDVATDNIAHCYIVTGADKLLSDAFCEEAVYALLGGSSHADVLYRKVKDRTHADVLRFPAEAKTFNRDEYLALTAELGYAPIDGDRRIFVIDGAETIKPNIQNRLLKTLEEPQAGYIFLIKTAGLATVLQTVVSRARVLELGTLPMQALKGCLSELGAYSESDLAWAAEYADGNVTRARTLLSKSEYRGMCEFVWTFLEKCESSRDLLPWYDRMMAYDGNLEDVLAFFAIAFRDVAVYLTAGESGIVARDRLTSVRNLAKNYSVRACVVGTELVRDSLKRLLSYANKQSVADELLFGILEARAKYA